MLLLDCNFTPDIGVCKQYSRNDLPALCCAGSPPDNSDHCTVYMQAQKQREAFRHQTSKKLLQAAAEGTTGPSEGAAAEGLKSEDYADLAALAGRLAAQQQEIDRLSSQLNAANAKRAELAKVRMLLAVLAGHASLCTLVWQGSWKSNLYVDMAAAAGFQADGKPYLRAAPMSTHVRHR